MAVINIYNKYIYIYFLIKDFVNINKNIPRIILKDPMTSIKSSIRGTLKVKSFEYILSKIKIKLNFENMYLVKNKLFINKKI